MKIKDAINPDDAGGQLCLAVATRVAKTLQISEGKPSKVGTAIVPFGTFFSPKKAAICFTDCEGLKYFAAFTQEELAIFHALVGRLLEKTQSQGEPA